MEAAQSPGETPSKMIGYFDCPSGISGDMILGAIVDCGVSIEQIKEVLALLPLSGYELTPKRVNKQGLAATQVEVIVQERIKERKLSEIIALIEESQIPERIKRKALQVFLRIGTVEAKIHGVELESVHLHELSGVDTIVDVVGAFTGMEAMGVDEVFASSLPLAMGTIEAAHGTLPLPAPATLALLEGVPIQGSEISKELVTPTGAAVLTSLVKAYGSMPSMRLLKTGYGAGKMDLPIPNVLRLMVGERWGDTKNDRSLNLEQLVCLETNIDNMNPEIYSYLAERLFDSGALDVSLIPIYMKKLRPGTLVNVLCNEEIAESLIEIIFFETSTLGIRKYPVDRYSIERKVVRINTLYGDVKVKFSRKGENDWNYAPEYEECRRLALQQGLPIIKIYRAAELAVEEYLRNQQKK